MCTGVGESEDEFAGGSVEIEKYPVVFNVAVTKSVKVAGKSVVSVLRRKGFALRKFKNDLVELVDVLAASKHLL